MFRAIQDDEKWVWYGKFRESSLRQWKIYFHAPEFIDIKEGYLAGQSARNNQKYSPVEDKVQNNSVYRFRDGFDGAIKEVFEVLKVVTSDQNFDQEPVKAILPKILRQVEVKFSEDVNWLTTELNKSVRHLDEALLATKELLWFEEQYNCDVLFKWLSKSRAHWKTFKQLKALNLDLEEEISIYEYCILILDELDNKPQSRELLRTLIEDRTPTTNRDGYLSILFSFVRHDTIYADFMNEHFSETSQRWKTRRQFALWYWYHHNYDSNEYPLMTRESAEEILRKYEVGFESYPFFRDTYTPITKQEERIRKRKNTLTDFEIVLNQTEIKEVQDSINKDLDLAIKNNPRKK